MIGIGTAKRAAGTALGVAMAAADLARHAAWYVNYHVRREARHAEPAPGRRD